MKRLFAPDVLALLLVVSGLLVFDHPPSHSPLPVPAGAIAQAAQPAEHDELDRALARMGDESDELSRALGRLGAGH